MEFVATGYRRMTVALFSASVVAVSEIFGGGLSQWGAIGLGLVTLGYYGTKFAEALATFAKAMLEKFKGGA